MSHGPQNIAMVAHTKVPFAQWKQTFDASSSRRAAYCDESRTKVSDPSLRVDMFRVSCALCHRSPCWLLSSLAPCVRSTRSFAPCHLLSRALPLAVLLLVQVVQIDEHSVLILTYGVDHAKQQEFMADPEVQKAMSESNSSADIYVGVVA